MTTRPTALQEDEDLKQVQVHLRKYFTSKSDYFSIAQAFSIWKSKVVPC